MKAVNLIPVDQRGGAARGAGRSGGAAYAVLGLIGGLALMALLYGMASHKASSSKQKVAALETQVQQAEAKAAALAPYTSFISLREQRVNAVTQLVDSRFDWAHAVHELGRVLPAGVSIASFTGTIGTAEGSSGPSAGSSAKAGASSAVASAAAKSGGSVASATPPGSTASITLSGCAKSQSLVALTLDRLRLMDGVTAVTLQSSTKSTSGSSSGGATGCPNSAPIFTMLVTYDPLPSQSAPTQAKGSSASTGGGASAVKPVASVGGTG